MRAVAAQRARLVLDQTAVTPAEAAWEEAPVQALLTNSPVVFLEASTKTSLE